MNKKSLNIFIILTGFSLIFLVSLQLFWLKNSYKREKESYHRIIEYAISYLDEKILNYFSPDYILETIPSIKKIESQDINKKKGGGKKMTFSKFLGYYYTPEGDSISIFGPSYARETITYYQIDSIINNVLSSFDIQKNYVFGIYNNNDSLLYINDAGYGLDELPDVYEFNVLNINSIYQDQTVKIYFPQSKLYVLKKFGIILTGNILLMLFIIGAFIYAFTIILRQKKIHEMRKDFIGNLTHEFKTPVSTVSLTLEGLMKFGIQNSPEKVDKYLSIAYKENKRLGLMIDKVLNIAAYEKGKLKLKLSEVHIHELINETIRSFDVHVKHRGGEIISDLCSESVIITADKEHLTQLIYNLLDNANKYSPDIPNIIIKTELSNNKDEIKIIISDNGIGIPAEQLKNIFKPFIRISETSNKNIKGFGLGLSYVSEVIKLHNGEINAESEQGKGSSFIIKLPLK